MALLNFKYGLHKNLPAWNANNVGTVFVTTDEQAMHIDLPNGRVVISQIITLDTVQQWQAMKPPYSAQAFYYIVDANALLKYTGDGTNHTWAQINSTADVENSISELQALVGTKDAEGNWITGLGYVVNQHTASIAGMEDAIEDLQEADKAFTGSLQVLQQRIENLNTVAGFGGAYDSTSAVPSPQPGKIYLINNVIKVCEKDSANNITFVDYPSINEQIANLRLTIAILQGNAAGNAALAELANKVTALETWKTTTDGIIGAPSRLGEDGQTTIPATGLYALIEAAQNAADAAQQRADDAWDSAKQANDAIGVEAHYDENNNPVPATGLRGQISQNTVAIADINNVIGAPAKDDKTPATGMHANIATNAKNIDDLATLVGKTAESGLRKEIATNASDIDKLEQRAGSLETIVGKPASTGADGEPVAATGLVASVNANTAAIEEEIARAKKAEEANADAIAKLHDDVMADIQTADAMVFKDVVGSEVELTGKEATAQVGHTYKASAEFEIDGIKVHIGDLLIATGEESEETGYITEVTWKHVPSGYIADYNPQIEAEEDIEDDNKIVLALSSGVAKDEQEFANRGDLGKIVFAADENSALTISAAAGTVTFGMAWGCFDDEATAE